jgi:Arc/MetJ-type ribon-helix-helix transcriptional regulator
MKRTQIYLTGDQRKALKTIGDRLGRSQSDVIREAIDRLVEIYQDGNRLELLQQARGLWAERDDLPDFQAVRTELDRL